MTEYRFSLERILDLRVEEERRQGRVVAEARRGADKARQAVQDLEALRRAGRASLTAAHGTGRAVGQLQNLEWIFQRMELELEGAQERARTADREMTDRLRDFQKAVQERQTLDRLKSRQRDAWTAERRQREQKAMDELALTRHARDGDDHAMGGLERP